MTALQNHAFQQLLAAWRRHDDVRRPDSIDELGRARMALDDARTDMHRSLTSLR